MNPDFGYITKLEEKLIMIILFYFLKRLDWRQCFLFFVVKFHHFDYKKKTILSQIFSFINRKIHQKSPQLPAYDMKKELKIFYFHILNIEKFG